MDCLFCKIVRGEVPARKVYEDDDLLAFHDINPVAPLHILIIPKKHIGKISELEDDDAQLMGQLINTSQKIAAESGVDGTGFRLVFNNGKDAHQTVFHIHLHLLAGRKFTWPPG